MGFGVAVSEEDRVTSARTEGEGEARSTERARGGAVSLSHRERPVNLNPSPAYLSSLIHQWRHPERSGDLRTRSL
jgi:hypothetical protein